jgi:ABC-2 type transport system permease protein
MIGEILALAMRDLKKWWKSKISVAAVFLRPLAWLVLFGKAFNPLRLVSGSSPAALTANLGGAPNYFSFMAAGMLSIMVLQISMRGMSSMVFDRYLGFFDKVLAAPVSRETLLLARTVSGVIRGLIQAVALFVIAIPLGMNIGSGFGILDLLGVFATLSLLGVSLSAFFASLGALVKRWETQDALLSAISLPLMFTSNVLYPVKSMPSWLQPFADLNPVTYCTQILRDVFYGGGVNGSQGPEQLLVLLMLMAASLVVLVVVSRRMSSTR